MSASNIPTNSQASSNTPSKQKPFFPPYTKQDINEKDFNKYIKQLIHYWIEKEANELVPMNLKTYNCPLPPARSFITVNQKNHLWKLRCKHRIRMLHNEKETNFKLRFHNIKDMNSVETKKEILKYKRSIYNCEGCPCCQEQDYLPPTTIIVPNPRVSNKKSNTDKKQQKQSEKK